MIPENAPPRKPGNLSSKLPDNQCKSISTMRSLLVALLVCGSCAVELRSGFILHDVFPPGTTGNGTCPASSYHGTDCDTNPSGYFTGVKTLADCVAKVKPCKMGNYLTWGATDNSCSWYNYCDFAHLCKDCSKDSGPNCPSPKCPHYFAFTSQVLRPTPAPVPTPAPTPPPGPAGCYIDQVGGISYIGGNIFGDHHQVNTSATADGCCKICQQYSKAENGHTACDFWQWDSVSCYGHPGPCCRLKSSVAWKGRTQGPSTATTGSIHPLPAPPGPPPTCQDGTNCGGTGLWTKWKDTTLPGGPGGNGTCVPGWCNPGTMPFPLSKDLVSWEFKSGANPGYGSGSGTKEGPNQNRFKASSADTFFPTWAADGNMYD
jgi:hypothetical protein